MEIITSLKVSELEQLVEKAVERVLSSQIIKKEQLPDKVGIEVASEITGLLKSTIYKKSYSGEIPCYRMGKRLVFSRSELLNWQDSRTIRKQSPSEIQAKSLQETALSKEERKHNQKLKATEYMIIKGRGEK